MKKILLGLALCLGLVNMASAQYERPYTAEIEQFKSLDSAHMPTEGGVLLIGSSTFTKWTDVQSYFPNDSIINRGFGGSTLKDVIDRVGDVVYPYNPRQIFIYCGDNDLVASDSVKVLDVEMRAKMLYKILRNKYPDVTIDYISIKYSPARKQVWSKITKVNAYLQKYFNAQPNSKFIDITKAMRNGKKGQVDESLFIEDGIHMNPEGYKIWQSVMAPYITKSTSQL